MKRVLLVEDSASTRGFVRDALEGGVERAEDLEVVEAASGFDALRLLPRERWDLIITDINMPDINGLELLAFIRKSDRHRATPVLIISSQSGQRDRDRGLALGANAYLTKPFTADAIREGARRLIQGDT